MAFPHSANDFSAHHTKKSVGGEEVRWIKHYSSSHKILLVGEGDFSFAASLAAAFGSASNLTATSLEYKKDLKKAYKKAVDNIQELQSKGCNVWHGVDATVMASHPCLKNMVFDCIVFNFPFAVLPKEKRGNLHHQTVLKKQQSLVVKFLENGKQMIGENGEIHITHRTDGLFGAWRIKFLASKHGFELVEASDFHISDYALYNAKWGNGSDDNFESYPSKTYRFRLPRPPLKPDSFSRPTLPSLQDVSIFPAGNSNAFQELPSLSLFHNMKHDDVIESLVAEEELIKKHYSSSQKILLVGEGDFSFGTSLVAAFGCASNLTATSLEHKRDLKKVYGKAVDNIRVLQSNGCKVWHAVDATVMASHPSLKNLVFDRIIFNFPFAVLSKQGWSHLHLESVLKKQRSLVGKFLENAKKMIGEKGEIHITHRKDGIFGAWRIKFLASKQGLELVGAIDFNICDYPGYNPKWGNGSDDNLESFPSKTYKFRLPHPPQKANSFSSKSTHQDVPIISPTKIYPFEHPEEFYAFSENLSHAHQELPSSSVSSGMNILACGASSRNTCSSHDNNNSIELNKVSQEFSVEELKSILTQQKANTSTLQSSSFVSHDSAEEKWVNKYSSSHKILLVGEGDFSFSASLAASFGSAVNIIATSLDSKKTVKREYDKAVHNISMLKAKGCKVLHSVDATAMASHPSLKGLAFDRIVFNFPFAIVPKDWSHRQICEHQSLVEKFLENSKQMIAESGEVHITHRTDGCFGAWRIKYLGTNQGLELVEAKKFNISDYPGYNPRWEIGSNGNVMCMHSKTYMFRLPHRPLKTVSCSSSPTEPSSISVEDVSILEPTNNDLGAELSVEFNSGFTENWANAHGKLTTPSLLFPKSNVLFGAESHNAVQDEVSARSCAKLLGASRWVRTEATSSFSSTGYQLKQKDTWQDNGFVPEEECAKHCSSSHKMVLVSEGDSSFSASLAAAFGSASNTTATSLDSKRVLKEQYEGAVYQIEELKRSGCNVMHGVDATAASNPKESAAAYSMFENDELYFPPMMFPDGGEATPSSVYATPTLHHFLLPSKYLGSEEKWIKHYSSHQKILLVGEGDFSFSACLAVAFGSAANMTATSLDSDDFLTTNYCKAFLHLRELKARGCKVMHGIDATCMIYNPCLMGSTFDRIVFNFPYAGFFKDIPRTSQLCCHQYLIRLFLHNAKQMLSGAEGEIHITHKTNGFHKEWNIAGIAVQEGLELVATVDFDAGDYPGYSHKYGFGGDNAFNCSPSQTYIFRLPPPTFMPWPWP
ncbi:unnamed protein product [Cuscuta epithymum]|uniref:25S rRNA (uridine-N(3))-methyltransferase BMT5-like domain-containing protein n=1 Tax=Cuscuta epithymum TaxID=186058 RepID=A0AAV0BZM5_9ASTE|nr:unnamed protein product [Cuscuta epithymum]CAH9143542.1 unnamed protein product [Cuscuta epithymum]